MTMLLIVGFFLACNKDDESGIAGTDTVTDFSKIKSRIETNFETGNITEEYYTYDEQGRENGYDKFVNGNHTQYTNYKYVDRGVRYEWIDERYRYNVAIVFYNNDYDPLKIVSKKITNAINGNKTLHTYQYDSIGRPVWYESSAVGYPPYGDEFSVCDDWERVKDYLGYYVNEPPRGNYTYNLRYDGLTLTMEPYIDPDSYGVASVWVVNPFNEKRYKQTVQFYDDSYTKIISRFLFSQSERDTLSGEQYEYDLQGRPIRYESFDKEFVTQYRYVYNGKNCTCDIEKYNKSSGAKVSESKVEIEYY